MPRQAVKEPEADLSGASGIARLKPGEFGKGYIGKPPSKVPDTLPPELTLEEEIERQVLVKLLLQWLTPNKISLIRADALLDKASLSKKLNKSSLETVRRFFQIEIPDVVKASLQRQYQDISP